MARSTRILQNTLNALRPRKNIRHFADDIFKWIFLNEKYESRLIFHWSLFLRAALTIFSSNNGLAPTRRQAIIWSNDGRLLRHICVTHSQWLNTLRPKQNGRHFADDIFKCIFLIENEWMSLEISLKFILKGPINNIPALVQIMAWRRPGDKPLSEPMMVSSPTHICVTRPQWLNCKDT